MSEDIIGREIIAAGRPERHSLLKTDALTTALDPRHGTICGHRSGH
jgi:hypothetical protein